MQKFPLSLFTHKNKSSHLKACKSESSTLQKPERNETLESSGAKTNRPRKASRVWAITRWLRWWRLVWAAWYRERKKVPYLVPGSVAKSCLPNRTKSLARGYHQRHERPTMESPRLCSEPILHSWSDALFDVLNVSACLVYNVTQICHPSVKT